MFNYTNFTQIVRPYMSKTNHVPYEMLDFQDIDRFFKIRFGIPYGSNNKFREPLLQFIKDINEVNQFLLM